MSNENYPNRKTWWLIAAVSVLIIAALVLVTSGALATWFDPEPEAALGTLLRGPAPLPSA